MPQSQGWLVCERCINPLTMQRQLIVLPPDPRPFFNTRPENYAVDEENYLATLDDDIIGTDSGETITTNIPNPENAGNTTLLVCSIAAPGGSLAVAYLDLFNGDPAAGGYSVLVEITGSSTRTNIASQLTLPLDNIAINTNVLTVAASSASVTNVTHVGIYNAASGGTLLMSGTVSATPTIAEGNPVQFPIKGLSIDLN